MFLGSFGDAVRVMENTTERKRKGKDGRLGFSLSIFVGFYFTLPGRLFCNDVSNRFTMQE